MNEISKFEAQAQKILDARIPLFDADGKRKSQTTLLIQIASPWTLFHAGDLNAYAMIPRNNHTETWPVRSSGFRRILADQFYAMTGNGCNGNSMADALNTIEAKGVHGEKRKIYLRIARVNDTIYIDMSDDQWRVIEIKAEGWKILDEAPVHFIRKNGMARLPTPLNNGDLSTLNQFINVEQSELKLVIGWMLGALRGTGPYPVLVLHGEHGSGKSTLSHLLRSIIDPSTVPLRPPPREIRDLLISALNNHLVVLDNLSGLKPEISDSICRLATGGGLDTRKLYTDTDQILVDIQRPVLVNGIDDIATRPDLMDRSIIVHCPTISPSNRRQESVFWKQFRSVKPAIFAGLLDALACALCNQDGVNMPEKPRMADFTIWVEAAAPLLKWKSGAFYTTYDQMIGDAVLDAIHSSMVGSVILAEMEFRDEWMATPTQLLNDLTERAGTKSKSAAWPRTERGLKNILKRLMPPFRTVGICIECGRTNRMRYYLITNVVKKASQPSQPSPKRLKPTADTASSGDASGDLSVTNRHRVTLSDRSVTDSPSQLSLVKGMADAASGDFLGHGDGCDALKPTFIKGVESEVADEVDIYMQKIFGRADENKLVCCKNCRFCRSGETERGVVCAAGMNPDSRITKWTLWRCDSFEPCL